MSEYTISLETRPGLCNSEWLDVVADRGLYDDERLISPALVLNTETGALSATFNVRAATFSEAGDVAWRAFVERVIGEPVPQDAILVSWLVELEERELAHA